MVVVGEHSSRDDSRETFLSFLNETLGGLAASIDKSFFKPDGVLDIEYLLDRKVLRNHVDIVLKAIDSVGDPIEREGALRSVLWIAMASLQIGRGLIVTTAKKKKFDSVIAALTAKRSTSRDIDDAIAALAGPLEAKHPRWRSGRIANEISDALHKQLAARWLSPLGPDAIRKRVKKHRTTVLASSKKRTDAGRSS